MRCCSLKSSPPMGTRPHVPCPLLIHHTFSPGPGLFTSTLGSRACFHLRDPLASEEGAPCVFWLLPVQLCHPFSTSPRVGEEQGEGAQSSFAFLRTGLHTPVWGAGLCLSLSCPGSSPPSPLQPVHDSQPWGAAMRGSPTCLRPRPCWRPRSWGGATHGPLDSDRILELLGDSGGVPTGREGLSECCGVRGGLCHLLLLTSSLILCPLGLGGMGGQ